MIQRSEWVWMPHPAHFCAALLCRFRLATLVGNVIVSTVGEMVTSRMQDGEFDDIGHDRKYETMVFDTRESEGCDVCPRHLGDLQLDFNGYNDAKSAFDGHMATCELWANADQEEEIVKAKKAIEDMEDMIDG